MLTECVQAQRSLISLHLEGALGRQMEANEAPRSKLRGITELKHSELLEIFPRLPLPLHIPFDGLPVCPLPYRGHIVPVGPKLPAHRTRFTAGFRRKISRAVMLLNICTIRPGATFGCALQSRWM